MTFATLWDKPLMYPSILRTGSKEKTFKVTSEMKMPGISSYALLQQIENALKRAKYICQGINILLKCIISA
jgi:hypothetical protein